MESKPQGICLLLRSVSGAGKSLLANNLQNLIGEQQCKVVSADDYFTDKAGEYVFKKELLGQAHFYCRSEFIKALSTRVPLIIVSNTNAKRADFNFYLERARQFGYIVHVMVIENYMGTTNSHNVPEVSLMKQEENIRKSLKLR